MRKLTTKIFIGIFILSISGLVSASEICYAKMFTAGCGGFLPACEFRLELCQFRIPKTDKIEVLTKYMNQKGYDARPLVTSGNAVAFVKRGSTYSRSSMFCLLKSNLRTDCEKQRFELTCSDVPSIRVVIPRNDRILSTYLRENSIELISNLGDGERLFQKY